MVINLVFIALLIGRAASYYCFSQCLTSVNNSCNASPYTCLSYNSPFNGVNSLVAGYSAVDFATALTMTSANNFKTSQTFTSFTCSATYTLPTAATFTYNILGKFVSTDYIYKRYTITQPHYQIIIRLSVTFIGVWSSNDNLNLYTYDGVTATNFPMRYSCTDSNINYTEILCSTSRNGNHVDCVLAFTQTISHNSTYLLVNISSLTSQKDPNNQFWSPLDLNVITVNCHSFCSACYNSLFTTCTSCVAGKYLNGNTCNTICSTGYMLANPNPLLGGSCVTSCPQGYYLSTSTCLACSSGCLSCTSSSGCLLTASSGQKYSLWMDKLALWIIIIFIGCLAIFGIFWRLLCTNKKGMSEQQERIMSEVNDTRHADEKVTQQQHHQPQEQKNIHIQEIDFNDHIMVDNNPRRRRRQERDMNRSNININF